VPRSGPETPKEDALRQHGVLNPRPHDVTEPRFQNREFFDPRDLVQVRYEMLRSVEVEKQPVVNASKSFGVSRPTFYTVKSAFEAEGLPGLLPKKRGPKGARKLTPEVIAFLQIMQPEKGPLRASELTREVEKRFGIRVHPRSIERTLRKKKKKRR